MDVKVVPAGLVEGQTHSSLDEVACEEEQRQIWSWNATVPDTVNRTVLSLIAEITDKQPGFPAVCAWDGDLTYGELDNLSTRLACHLVGLGIGRNVIVPLCFEKSKWTSVAQLAVMKAGGASFTMDVTQPEGRLRAIMQQGDPKVVLSSASRRPMASRLASATVVQVDEATLASFVLKNPDLLPKVLPSDLVYVSYTSGSTGIPKGVCISHSNVCSAIYYQGPILGFHTTARVLDFAPYSFDVAWSNVLHTLCSGGCLCVPSFQEMLDDLPSCIQKFQASFMNITPSTLRTIEPSSKLSTLQTILLSGEMPYQENILQWAGEVRLLNTYGPAECTWKSAFSVLHANQRERPDLGIGIGCRTWIVGEGGELAAIGSVGELWLEGPLVGQGYQSNPTQTAASFIVDPPWLLRGGPGHRGRHGRLYRTGDLVRYRKPDGKLIFVGRKDGQVKLRGQRVELGEVEHHVRACLAGASGTGIVAETFSPHGNDNAVLAIFLGLGAATMNSEDEWKSTMRRMTAGTERRLIELLPAYMMPSVYIPLQDLPIAATGKTDRRRLREIGASFTLEQLAAFNPSRKERRAPATDAERQLRSLWAAALAITDVETIGADDNFLHVGGDSIKAIRLVSLARDLGFSFTVTDIFSHPQLSELATISDMPGTLEEEPTVPFSLLKSKLTVEGMQALRKTSSTLCNVKPSQVEDVFPCTPLQEGLIALTAKRAGDYVGQYVFRLKSKETTDTARFRTALEQVVASTPILRTRIADLAGHGLVQIIVNEPVQWSLDKVVSNMDDISADLHAEKEKISDLGKALIRFGIFECDTEYFFVWTIHHALYDGWSRQLVLERLQRAYLGRPCAPLPPFQAFVKHIRDLDGDEATIMWCQQFKGLESQTFPALPAIANFQPKADRIISHYIAGLLWPKSAGITASTVIRTAWAIITSQYTDSKDVVFGVTVTGRHAAVAKVERMVGPTFATVPLRVKLDTKEDITLSELLQEVQENSVKITEFEQIGLSRIRQISSDAEKACQFQTLLVIQPAEEYWKSSGEVDMFLPVDDKLGDQSSARLAVFNTYAMLLEVQLEQHGLHLHFSFDNNVINSLQVERIAQQLEHIIQQLCMQPTKALSDVALINDLDLRDIWTWNAVVPESVQACVHDLIAETIRRQPGAPAICAWDGDLSYSDLDALSRPLAHHLATIGVGPNILVPLCFEKSKWVPVAMLAVMQAGGASVALDSTLPEERLRSILRQVNGSVILSSKTNEALTSRLAIGGSMIVVPENLVKQERCQKPDHTVLPTVKPSDRLFVVFTSGSTGTPKGAIVTHSNFSSAIKHQQASFGIDSTYRVYDFASYAFDVAWSNALHSLSAGACLCIPNQEDRRTNIAKSIRDLSANYAHLTPTVARLFHLSETPGLKVIRFGGEPLLASDVQRWQAIPTMYNTYGPAECTIMVTLDKINTREIKKTPSIGKNFSGNTWVVEKDNGKTLVPIGGVGELWVEGPLVGGGYLSDREKTTAHFVENPPWLVRGRLKHPGRRGRLYRTGDLVRYQSDGKLEFVGRKDRQVKIRGQRVELDDVGFHVRQNLVAAPGDSNQVVAEVITPKGSRNSTLVAFLGIGDSFPAGIEEGELQAAVDRMTNGTQEKLAEVLPPYMIPNIYIGLRSIPMTPTGKINRRVLRGIGESKTLEELAALNPTRSTQRVPANKSECRLQKLWASVLGVDINTIGADDSFLRIGGDSVGAMRLVARARHEGFALTVADVFNRPRLSDLAMLLKEQFIPEEEHIVPFQLLVIDAEEARTAAARLCAVEPLQIEDIFPCTPLQEGLLALTERRAGDYVVQFVYKLRATVNDINRFQLALKQVVETTPILRTRTIDLVGQGLVQVLVNEPIHWCSQDIHKFRTSKDADLFLRAEKQQIIGLGRPLVRFGLFEGCGTGHDCYFVWTIHHALYDGWSMPLIRERLEKAYTSGESPKVSPPFQAFVKYVVENKKEDRATEFWREQFDKSEAQIFPALPSTTYQPKADSLIECAVQGLQWPQNNDITASTVMRAAWSLVSAQYTESRDVVFGVTVSGRQVAVGGIEEITGPTIATVPVRVVTNEELSVKELLKQVQDQAIKLSAFEQIGLQRIRQISENADQACRFQTLLVVQPKIMKAETESPLFTDNTGNDQSYGNTGRLFAFNTYAILLDCQLLEDGIHIRASFDSAVIDCKQLERVLQQFRHILNQICQQENGARKLSAIMVANEQDLRDICTWNRSMLVSIEFCVHDLITKVVRERPDAGAVCAWDGNWTYGELDSLSTQLAHQLVTEHQIKPGVIVPLCFEKSKWVPITILAIMKAGGASVMLDVTQPQARLRSIVDQINPHVILCSALQRDGASQLADVSLVQVDETCLASIKIAAGQPRLLPRVSCSEIVYVSYTSGSTGSPKGACVSHSNVCSSVYYQGHELGFTEARVLDFAPYSFDVAWSNVLHTLCAGGCLCIPSSEEMLNNLSGAIEKFRADFINITPSVLRTIEPTKTSLKTVLLSGEMPYPENISQWAGKVRLINTYGPAECTWKSAFSVIPADEQDRPDIGIGVGARTWIVDADCSDNLVAIGCVGELWLEGPLVGQGYLSSPDLTAAAFVTDPPWRLRGGLDQLDQLGHRGRLYRTGDLVRYKSDGRIVFIGRKDGQIKMHGQRVELGDVGFHVRQSLAQKDIQVVAEIVIPKGANSTILAAFLGFDHENEEIQAALKNVMDGMEDKLADSLPKYMIPTAYIPLQKIPMTATGKVDRRRLREIGKSMSLEKLTELNPLRNERKARPPTTDLEKQLQELWSSVLEIEIDTIRADDSFLRIGGDSIAAMRLVGLARERGLGFTVANVFKRPRLCDLAGQISQTRRTEEVAEIEPFSILGGIMNKTDACTIAATQCGIDPARIQDLFPTTPLQEALLAMTAVRAGAYIAQNVLELSPNVTVHDIKTSVTEVCKTIPILRTRIVDLHGQGSVQVVVDEEIQWSSSNKLQTYLSHDRKVAMGLGTRLNRLAIINDSEDGKRYLVWTLHHAVYDGWSWPLLLEAVESMYKGKLCQPWTPFQAFIKHITEIDRNEATHFWSSQFANSEAQIFPSLPSSIYQPRADKTIFHQIEALQWPESDTTPSTFIRTAWSVLAARYTNSSDVVFGVTVTGRQAAVQGVERMPAPTIATVPIRVKFEWEQTLEHLQREVQKQSIEILAFEQTGLQRIRDMSAEAKHGCQFQALLVVHSQNQVRKKNSDLFTSKYIDQEKGAERVLRTFGTYAMTVEFWIDKKGLRLRVSFDSAVIILEQAERVLHQFEHILRQFCAQDGAKRLSEIETASEKDLKVIWKWNSVVPETANACVHDFITNIVRDQPTAPAVCAWDGEFTYRELDELSTRLALHLVELGVGPGKGMILPLCIEKSKWMPVAMLAVMKAGAASVAIDLSQPKTRLGTILQQVKPTLCLCSSANRNMANLLPNSSVVIVDNSHIEQLHLSPETKLPKVKPSDKLYVVFTSGSTGQPKGVAISHSNVSSAILHQSGPLGFKPSSRVYDFASYAFDAAWSNAIYSLSSGACLCIPSEADRKDDLVGSMKKLRVTYADLTPSTARLLPFKTLKMLDTLVLAGEQLPAQDAKSWSQIVKSKNVYGPCECTPTATIRDIDHESTLDSNIGKGVGVVTWVVDPLTGTSLTPIGAIGELLLEGPLVGPGYHLDPEKTAAAFVSDAPWLIRGGRRGRLYKTGDLVQYMADGSLTFIGRKDAQVKIRGQRVELGDIEYHIRNSLAESCNVQVAAEVITPRNSSDRMLVAFMAVQINQAAEQDDIELQALVQKLTAGLQDRLAVQLPIHMVPAAYVSIHSIPMTGTGKTDRRRLREIGESMTQEQLVKLNTTRVERRKPTTDIERRLHLIWARVLCISDQSFGVADSFFQIGGESIRAMRLVGAAREQGLCFTVTDVFKHPRICDLAGVVTRKSDASDETVEPFSLLQAAINKEEARELAAVRCGVQLAHVRDIFPCTPLQEGLIALTARRPGHYVSRKVLELRPAVDINMFRTAWEQVVATIPILRTRIVDLPDQGFCQVVLEEQFEWTYDFTDLKTYLCADEQVHMDLGTKLVRFGLVEEGQIGRRFFVWTMHHALYDGWSIPLLKKKLVDAYERRTSSPAPPFQQFVKYITSIDHNQAAVFWRSQFNGLEAQIFPAVPPMVQPRADNLITHRVGELRWPRTDITASTIVRATWALLAAQYTDCSDIVFGSTVTGRQAAAPRVEHIIGPTFATIPIRIAWDRDISLEDLLVQVQMQAVETVPFEQTGLQRIRQLSSDAGKACQFQTLLVIHPPGRQSQHKGDLFFQETNGQNSTGADSFNTYALMFKCQLEDQGLQMRMSFDSTLMKITQVERLTHQFEHLLRQVCAMKDQKSKLSDLTMLSASDLGEIWKWNKIVPEPAKRCVHDLITERTRKQPDAQAICAWDGNLTYKELDEQSSRLAYQLVALGVVGPDILVPLCFEKSKWTPVAMLGVMKAGGASIALDSSQPIERLRAIVQQAKSYVILASSTKWELASRLVDGKSKVVVLEKLLKLSHPRFKPQLPSISSTSMLYVVFTSGSTGIPKGAIITHSNFTSAVEHQQKDLCMDSTSRIYDFVSYAFDVAWSNVLHALTAGACLCIPNDHDRRGGIAIAESMRALNANYVHITPTVARLLDPSEIRCLKTVAFIGEPLLSSDIAQWRTIPTLLNTYGPAECTVTITLENIFEEHVEMPNIGTGTGGNTWVVDKWNTQILAPIGSVGELVLEGPLVGRGYLFDDEKTSVSFIEDPVWLLRGGPNCPGRHGRLYKTGDLVQYDANGKLVYVGRKDTQVKINGQRVELGEIEHHIKQSLAGFVETDVVTEVILPNGSTDPMLVAFLSARKTGYEVKAQIATAAFEENLAGRLPHHMIPSAYHILERIPTTATGKTDRRQLREIVQSMKLEELMSLRASRAEKRRPITAMEVQLQGLWASTLGIDLGMIGADDSFLRIGGDSIKAMRLVAAARDQGLSLLVEDVFRQPQLWKMATLIKESAQVEENEVEPFSLLDELISISEVRTKAAVLCAVTSAQVEDVFPCTPLQEGLIALTTKRAGDYIVQYVLELGASIDPVRFKNAVQEMVRTTPILRTRIIDLGRGLLQAVINESIQWSSMESRSDTYGVDAYLQAEKQQITGLCEPLSRFGFLKRSTSTHKHFFVWTMHHALYDGWSLPLMWERLEEFYLGVKQMATPSFQKFVKHIMHIDDHALSWWREQFEGMQAEIFPALPSTGYQPKADDLITHYVKQLQWPESDITPSTVVRTAWSILAATYTDSNDDVLYGVTSSGRQAAVLGIEQIVGPTIATVPVRVSLGREKTVNEMLLQIQKQSVDLTTFEQIGLQRIRQISDDAERACQFQTLLVIQPKTRNVRGNSRIFVENGEEKNHSNQAYTFNTCAMLVECQLGEEALGIRISFDSTVIKQRQATRLAQQMERILVQLCREDFGNKKISDIEIASEQDLEDIWNWNATVPEAVSQGCVHDLIQCIARKQPKSPAVSAWDGGFTYQELDTLSSRLASQLVRLQVGPGTTIPLCFEKSKWTPVAMLAAMKAGAASVAMDSSQPEKRLRTILEQIKPTLILSSTLNFDLSNRLLGNPEGVVVPAAYLAQATPIEERILPVVPSSSTLCILFTSGSTGKPKGSIITHVNFRSGIEHHQAALGFDASYRVFDFASYAFDAVWSNNLYTLATGGCVCIPSDEDRRSDLAGALERFKCSYVLLTPSAARTLMPESVPSLKTVVLGGENITEMDVARWKSHASVILAYGPSECTIFTSFSNHFDQLDGKTTIGTGFGLNTWVVDPMTGSTLTPIGAVGELLLEGPLVTPGYIGEPEKTATAMLDSPPWLLRGSTSQQGRRGRLFKTGDLVRYGADGVLFYCGRKDTQIKIRGQRVELGDVENHLENSLDTGVDAQIFAEMITPQGSNNPMLVALVNVDQMSGLSDAELLSAVKSIAASLDSRISAQLPTFMIPMAYVPLSVIPITATGKTDRRRLREIGASLTLEQLAAMHPSREAMRTPTTKIEKLLQELWASLLGVDTDTIGANDNFLRIGGDSIGAMRLVGTARAQGISFTVADVFKHPRLCDLALVVKDTHLEEEIAIPQPFSLLTESDTTTFLQQHVHSYIDQYSGSIEDVLPTTDFQDVAIHDVFREPPSRWPFFIHSLPSTTDFGRLEWACQQLTNLFDILRTVFIPAPMGGKFLQVVLRSLKPRFDVLETQDSIQSFVHRVCQDDLQSKRVLGTSFVRFMAIKCSYGENKLIFRLSHAQYDGYSYATLLKTLSSIYSGEQDIFEAASFRQFMAYNAQRKTENLAYWKQRMNGSCSPEWSNRVLLDEIASAADRLTVKRRVSMPRSAQGISIATLFHAACALAFSHQSNQSEVVFGRLVTGRSMLPPKLQDVAGPCLSEIPIRLTISPVDTISIIAATLQQQIIDDSSYESVGMLEIIRNCTDWPAEVCDFGWRTSFQQFPESNLTISGTSGGQSHYEREQLPRMRPELYATPVDGGLELAFEGNRKLIGEETVEVILGRIRVILGEC